MKKPVSKFRTPEERSLLCPRCRANAYAWGRNGGARPPALSRVDDKTYVCEPCGTDEALREWIGLALPGKDQWPVTSPEIAAELEALEKARALRSKTEIARVRIAEKLARAKTAKTKSRSSTTKRKSSTRKSTRRDTP